MLSTPNGGIGGHDSAGVSDNVGLSVGVTVEVQAAGGGVTVHARRIVYESTLGHPTDFDR